MWCIFENILHEQEAKKKNTQALNFQQNVKIIIKRELYLEICGVYFF